MASKTFGEIKERWGRIESSFNKTEEIFNTLLNGLRLESKDFSLLVKYRTERENLLSEIKILMDNGVDKTGEPNNGVNVSPEDFKRAYHKTNDRIDTSLESLTSGITKVNLNSKLYEGRSSNSEIETPPHPAFDGKLRYNSEISDDENNYGPYSNKEQHIEVKPQISIYGENRNFENEERRDLMKHRNFVDKEKPMDSPEPSNESRAPLMTQSNSISNGGFTEIIGTEDPQASRYYSMGRHPCAVLEPTMDSDYDQYSGEENTPEVTEGQPHSGEESEIHKRIQLRKPSYNLFESKEEDSHGNVKNSNVNTFVLKDNKNNQLEAIRDKSINLKNQRIDNEAVYEKESGESYMDSTKYNNNYTSDDMDSLKQNGQRDTELFGDDKAMSMTVARTNHIVINEPDFSESLYQGKDSLVENNDIFNEYTRQNGEELKRKTSSSIYNYGDTENKHNNIDKDTDETLLEKAEKKVRFNIVETTKLSHSLNSYLNELKSLVNQEYSSDLINEDNGNTNTDLSSEFSWKQIDPSPQNGPSMDKQMTASELNTEGKSNQSVGGILENIGKYNENNDEYENGFPSLVLSSVVPTKKLENEISYNFSKFLNSLSNSK